MSRKNRRNQRQEVITENRTPPVTSSSTPDPHTGASAEATPATPSSMPEADLALPGGVSEAVYLQERTSLVEIEQKSADQHDKAILTIATGGLALSLAFLKDIAPNPQAATWKYVGLSWLCFVASILTILASFLTSQSACRTQRVFLDELYRGGLQPGSERRNWWALITCWLNSLSYVLVFLAVVFLTIFSWLNLG